MTKITEVITTRTRQKKKLPQKAFQQNYKFNSFPLHKTNGERDEKKIRIQKKTCLQFGFFSTIFFFFFKSPYFLFTN